MYKMYIVNEKSFDVYVEVVGSTRKTVAIPSGGDAPKTPLFPCRPKIDVTHCFSRRPRRTWSHVASLPRPPDPEKYYFPGDGTCTLVNDRHVTWHQGILPITWLFFL